MRRRKSGEITTLLSVVRSESRFFPYGRRNPDLYRDFAIRKGRALTSFDGKERKQSSKSMGALAKSITLFLLNWIDAQLTLFWVRSDIATEANSLMAQVLQAGDAPFMLTKLAIGAFAGYVLYRCSHLTIARRGMQLVLTVYGALMFVHLATGLSALGWSQPLATVTFVSDLSFTVLSLLS